MFIELPFGPYFIYLKLCTMPLQGALILMVLLQSHFTQGAQSASQPRGPACSINTVKLHYEVNVKSI
uniref:Putative secreted protein n=1 Tax=Amblyomma triste TaxID=251400 RepID=A0A023G0U2_AMBTT